MPKEWMQIRVQYLDGSEIIITKEVLMAIERILPVIEALENAKSLKNRLNTLLK